MRRVLTGVVAAAALALPATGTAAQGAATLTQVGRVQFPDRAFVLSLAEQTSLDSSRVRVLEDGHAVNQLLIVPPWTGSRSRFGVVLLLDASDSMHGAPITAAFEAARAFAAHRASNEAIGVVAFNDTVRVLQRPTNSASAIDATLASPPPTSEGTRLYDAVTTGIRLLGREHVEAGSVVVLSDGTDTASRTSEAATAALARSQHVRIFTIGLRSGQFNPSAMAALAASSGGTYAEAGSARGLTPLYDALGAQLANEYLIEYRSSARPSEHVRVDVSIDGRQAASAAYVAPAVGHSPTPYHRSLLRRFWNSPASLVFTALAASFLIVVALVLTIRGTPNTVRERISGFTHPRQGLAERSEEPRFLVARRLVGRAERSLAARAWWQRFEEEVEILALRLSAVQVVATTAVATLLVAGMLGVVFPSAALLALVIPVAVVARLKTRLARTRTGFAEQLPDNLQVIVSALRTGQSFVGALALMVEDASEPARREFRRVLAEEQLGVEIDAALRETGRRMQSTDLEHVALVAGLQRDSGGNTAEVLDRTIDTIRERGELRRLVHTLTAQGRLARWIVTGIPIGLALVITALNPTYMAPLYSTTVGQALLVVVGAMVATGSYLIGRIVDIKV
jgi:tight adherence protein B